ncbi:PA2778 family cysteine peptidase [Desulfopila aestuarii]|uniref:Uncharacterized protein n=1 Tax=Desulfopila aestuarii DSM 18488 TaxID=1121416 RepID=A0A1M7Y9R1_9BACT|nr:PA2778 family cysteine peptidase [Desulfopila aestuarii]SHO49329.1 hypothetical protein SAMN02745220_02800 [Desulfopila aestuarii DSM 18488]
MPVSINRTRRKEKTLVNRNLFFFRPAKVLVIVLLCIASLLTGCSLPRSVTTDGATVEIELNTVPFFPQEEYQCGPAALAALLVSSDVVTLPDLLSPALYIPKRHGTLQLEMIASIRSFNRVPYQLRPEVDDIVGELRAGRPVLVLQNLGLNIWPVYHYAVVIGVLRNGSLILRSGTTERLIIERDTFLNSWEKAGQWAMVALKGNELPADHDLARYLSAVSRIEAIGNSQLAEECYKTVLTRHPYNDLAVFGLANTMFAQANFTAAATFYSYLLRRDPTRAEAANNLAESLAALHCYQLAIELLDRFL